MLVELCVEPSTLELGDNHQSIPLTSVQAIFPGAIGLCYQAENTSKCHVQFDGKSFLAPERGWYFASKSYSVILGGSNAFSLDVYQNACKQLESTAKTIQRLMSQNSDDSFASKKCMDQRLDHKLSALGAKNGRTNVRERYGSFRNQVATLKSSHEANANRIDLWLPHKDSDELERQFSELSNILVGKNAIIESQRRQLQTERLANEELERLNEQAKAELEEWKQKWVALDQELRLISEIGTKQEYMGNKVKMLSAELENVKNSNNIKIEEMQKGLFRHKDLQNEYSRLIAENERNNCRLNELLQKIQRLEIDLDEHQRQYAEQSKCNYALEERLCRENIGLAEWSKKLELENKQQKMLLNKLQSETKQQMVAMTEEFQLKMDQFEEDYKEKCKETANLNDLIESLNRHLTQISCKYNELDDAYKDLRKSEQHFREKRRAGSPVI